MICVVLSWEKGFRDELAIEHFLDTQCKGKVSRYYDYLGVLVDIEFELEEDALMFKLRFDINEYKRYI